MATITVLEGVRDPEGKPVELDETGDRPLIRAWNEGGYNCTEVDLGDLLSWLRTNRPDFLEVR